MGFPLSASNPWIASSMELVRDNYGTVKTTKNPQTLRIYWKDFSNLKVLNLMWMHENFWWVQTISMTTLEVHESIALWREFFFFIFYFFPKLTKWELNDWLDHRFLFWVVNKSIVYLLINFVKNPHILLREL